MRSMQGGGAHAQDPGPLRKSDAGLEISWAGEAGS
jgi:hypothetical protein